MASRRMFAMTIIDSDAFLDMPLSTQALYFHLSMRADDDGFINNPKKVQRLVMATDDDMKLLIAKSFIIPFKSGVVVIKHWKIHNYIKSDRYKPTVYQEEKELLTVKSNNAYTLDTECLHDVSETDTQDRLGKDRLELELEKGERERIDYQAIVKLYNETCVSFPRCTTLSETRRKAIKARFNNGHTFEDFKKVFEKAEASSFMKGSNKRDWSASFDWMMKDGNFEKVLEGNYDDKDTNQPKTDAYGREYKDGLLVWNIKYPKSEHPPYYGAPPEWFENGELVLDRVTAVYQPKEFSVGFYEPKVLTKEEVLEEITFRKEYFAKHGEIDS